MTWPDLLPKHRALLPRLTLSHIALLNQSTNPLRNQYISQTPSCTYLLQPSPWFLTGQCSSQRAGCRGALLAGAVFQRQPSAAYQISCLYSMTWAAKKKRRLIKQQCLNDESNKNICITPRARAQGGFLNTTTTNGFIA